MQIYILSFWVLLYVPRTHCHVPTTASKASKFHQFERFPVLYSALDDGRMISYAESYLAVHESRKRRFLDYSNANDKFEYVFSRRRAYGLVCRLCLMMDSQFMAQYGSDEADSKLREMIDRVSWIFRNTDFNGDKLPDNIGFAIRRIRKNWHLIPGEDPADYYTKRDSIEMLKSFGRDNYSSDCCIAVGLTMKPFLNHQGGVSFIASNKVLGGACEDRDPDPEENIASMNLVLMTGSGPDGWILDFEQLGMVLAHELGHSLGGRHDNPVVGDSSRNRDDESITGLNLLGECSGHEPRRPFNDTVPLGYGLGTFEPPNGRFIMWSKSFKGKKTFRPNNFLFSNCSKRAMAEVLRSPRISCFHPDPTPFCGNGILEATEECDCGLELDCERLNCCGSRHSSGPCRRLSSDSNCPTFPAYNRTQKSDSGASVATGSMRPYLHTVTKSYSDTIVFMSVLYSVLAFFWSDH